MEMAFLSRLCKAVRKWLSTEGIPMWVSTLVLSDSLLTNWDSPSSFYPWLCVHHVFTSPWCLGARVRPNWSLVRAMAPLGFQDILPFPGGFQGKDRCCTQWQLDWMILVVIVTSLILLFFDTLSCAVVSLGAVAPKSCDTKQLFHRFWAFPSLFPNHWLGNHKLKCPPLLSDAFLWSSQLLPACLPFLYLLLIGTAVGDHGKRILQLFK